MPWHWEKKVQNTSPHTDSTCKVLLFLGLQKDLESSFAEDILEVTRCSHSPGYLQQKTSFFLDIGNLANDFVSLCLLSARRQGLIDGSDARDCFSLFVLIWTFANHFHELITKGSNGFKQRRLSWRVMFQLQSFSYSCGYHSSLQVIEAITMTLSASTPNISRILFQEFDSL